jgi:hypothetical protein
MSAAAVASATAVESTTTTAACATAREASACTAAAREATSAATGITTGTASVTSAIASAVTAAVSTVAAAIAIDAAITTVAVAATVSITATEPRPSTDEDAAVEPRRSVITVRCASVGSIVIVAVGTDRSGIRIAADADAYRDLRFRFIRRGGQSQAHTHCSENR